MSRPKVKKCRATLVNSVSGLTLAAVGFMLGDWYQDLQYILMETTLCGVLSPSEEVNGKLVSL